MSSSFVASYPSSSANNSIISQSNLWLMVASTPKPIHFWIIELDGTSKIFDNSSTLENSAIFIVFLSVTTSESESCDLSFLYTFFFDLVSRLALIFLTVAVVDFDFFESVDLGFAGLFVVPVPTCDSISDSSTFLKVFLLDLNSFFFSNSNFFLSDDFDFWSFAFSSSICCWASFCCSFFFSNSTSSSFSLLRSLSSSSLCFSKDKRLSFLFAFCCSRILVSWISLRTCSFLYLSTDSLSLWNSSKTILYTSSLIGAIWLATTIPFASRNDKISVCEIFNSFAIWKILRFAIIYFSKYFPFRHCFLLIHQKLTFDLQL